jgi:hypothetical protein
MRSFYRELAHPDERFLASIAAVSTWRIRSFLDERVKDEGFSECVRSADAEFRNLEIQSADL